MTSQHDVISLHDQDAWEEAIAPIPHTWGHTWTAAAATPCRPDERVVLCTWDGGGARLVLPLIVRPIDVDGGWDVASPHGFSGPAATGDCGAWAASWPSFAAARGWVSGYVALSPVLADPQGVATADAVRRQDVYLLDLDRGEDALLAEMSGNRRRQIQRWLDEAPDETSDRGQVLAFLAGGAAGFFEARGAHALRDLPSSAWEHLLDDPRVLVQAVSTGGEVQAVSLFGRTPWGADYLHGISVPGAERHSAGLVWRAVRELIDTGTPVLNLGGGITTGDGVAAFKRRFGGRAVPLRALHQVYRAQDYERLCARSGLSARPTGWFPRYRGGPRA